MSNIHSFFSACHPHCKEGCSDGTAIGCDACKDGYRMGEDGCEGTPFLPSDNPDICINFFINFFQ